MPPGPVASLPNRGAAFGAAKSPPFKPPATLRNTPSLATPHSYRLAKSLATASPPSRAPVVRPAPIACGDARSSAGAAPDHTPPPAKFEVEQEYIDVAGLAGGVMKGEAL